MNRIDECKIGDMLYPKRMGECRGAPKRLFFIGDIGICNEKVIGVIGRRETGLENLEKSKRIGEALAEIGYVVLNGLAVGCDTWAIRGALDKGGKVVAVLPCGLDEIYPKSNENLAREIVEKGGCLVSEYMPKVTPERYTFVQRDRIQAMLAEKIVVVYCDRDGGTMKTVEYAMKYGKPVGCLTHDIDFGAVNRWTDITYESGTEGNSFLIETGRARPISGIDALMEFLWQQGYEQMSLFD